MVEVVVNNLTRRFGDVVALDDVSFDVKAGEFLTLLGPSGCGKSTTLGALAGLDRPTAGLIRIGNTPVFDSARNIFVDAQYRRLGLMFQSYALWPHMTVEGNLRFALELNGVRGTDATKRINEVLGLVDLANYNDRYPAELSGGQQQRVALARTIVYNPTILLLDEPLSNLDAKLREKARLWLGEVQRKSGLTTIFVTHDQSEALSLSDRIIVMQGGRIAQIGTPQEIYTDPANAFVADFVGASNVFTAKVASRNGSEARVSLGPDVALDVQAGGLSGAPDELTICARPESLSLADAPGENTVPCDIIARSYLGSRVHLVVRVGDYSLRVDISADARSSGSFVRIPKKVIKAFASA